MSLLERSVCTHHLSNAAVLELMCTGVPPAKLKPPRTPDQRDRFHVQQAIGSYTRVLQTKTTARRGPRQPRSAITPMARMRVSNINSGSIENTFESEILFRQVILAIQRQRREEKGSTEIANETTTGVTKC